MLLITRLKAQGHGVVCIKSADNHWTWNYSEQNVSMNLKVSIGGNARKRPKCPTTKSMMMIMTAQGEHIRVHNKWTLLGIANVKSLNESTQKDTEDIEQGLE